MRRLFCHLSILLATLLAGPAQAADRIGLVAPLSGNLALLGEQMRKGAIAAANATNLNLHLADDRCSAEGGAEAAEALLEAEVSMVVGFLCSEAIEAALPLLTAAGVPVITPGVRATGLTDQRQRTGWLIWRTAPRADQEREVIGRILTRRWADQPFAILDDGTTHQRDLAEHLRLSAEEAGLKPALVESYRPGLETQAQLVAQLRRAGIAHAFIGGDRQDVAQIAQDAAAAEFELALAGGEALRAAPGSPDLLPGTLMIGLPEAADTVAESGILSPDEAEGYGLAAFVAVEIAAAALARHESTGSALPDILNGESFPTLQGPLRFNEKGDLTGDAYRLFRYDGRSFIEEQP